MYMDDFELSRVATGGRQKKDTLLSGSIEKELINKRTTTTNEAALRGRKTSFFFFEIQQMKE